MFWLGLAIGWLVTTLGWLVLLVVLAAGRRPPEPTPAIPERERDYLAWLEDEHDWPAS